MAIRLIHFSEPKQRAHFPLLAAGSFNPPPEKIAGYKRMMQIK